MFGNTRRPQDRRLAHFDAESADLVAASPIYQSWRERLISKGEPSTRGLKLALQHRVFVEIDATTSTEQPIAFSIDEIPNTRFRLFHSRRLEAEDRLLHETSEHYWLRIPRKFPYQRLVRLVAETSPMRMQVQGRLRIMTSVEAPEVPPVELRVAASYGVDGSVYPDFLYGTFNTRGVGLAIMRVHGQNAILLDGQIVSYREFATDNTEASAKLRVAESLPDPAGRELIRQHIRGTPIGPRLSKLVLTSTTERWLSESPCLRCGQVFSTLFDKRRFGIGSTCYRICGDCHGAIQEDLERLPSGVENDSLEWLLDLTTLLGRVPSQDWWQRAFDDIDLGQYLKLRGVHRQSQSLAILKDRYGSWFGALVAAGVLPEGSQTLGVGTRVLAEDGHVCASIGEKTIDDWLHRLDIPHDREPTYPGSKMRADFVVGGVFIEYFGLSGIAMYDEKSERKRALAQRSGIQLIEIFPQDILDWSSARLRVARELGISLRTELLD